MLTAIEPHWRDKSERSGRTNNEKERKIGELGKGGKANKQTDCIPSVGGEAFHSPSSVLLPRFSFSLSVFCLSFVPGLATPDAKAQNGSPIVGPHQCTLSWLISPSRHHILCYSAVSGTITEIHLVRGFCRASASWGNTQHMAHCDMLVTLIMTIASSGCIQFAD